MNCFTHPDRPAIGTCLACHRGVCHECAAEVGRAVACRGRCERDVQRYIDVREWSLRQPQLYLRRSHYGRAMMMKLGLYVLVVGAIAGLMAYADDERALAVLCMSAAAAGLVMAVMYGRSSPVDRPTACISCGYNLTGNTSGRCPECGTAC